MKKIASILFLLFLIAGAIKTFGQSTVTTGQPVSLSVTNHVGNTYKWGLYLDDQAIVAANTANYTLSASANTANFSISVAGTYYAIVMETDGLGCSIGRSLQITVLPNNSKVLFTSITSSACYQANNDFTIPLQFNDGNGQPLSANHFPMLVSFRINGVNQPAQILAFANQNLSISGSAFTANPNSDTTVEVELTGATDIDKLNLQPETTSAQHIHTRILFRQLTSPTVASQTTDDTTPTISGTANVGTNETFTVSVNGFSYLPGDGNLLLSGTTWYLTIPANRALADGIYEITATVANAHCNLSDATANELMVDTRPAMAERWSTNDINITFRNTSVSGNVLVNDAGFYGFNSSVTAIPGLLPVHGTLSLAADGQYTYTPKPNFTGTDNFYYSVCTPEKPAACDTVNVTVRVLPEVLVQIPPVANDDEMQVQQNTVGDGNVLANDLSVSGEKLILNVKPKEMPKWGTLVLKADGSVVYTPQPGFSGRDGFVYEICGVVSGQCATARATITVSPDPKVTLFAADDVFFAYGKPISGDLLVNDAYPSANTLNVNRTPVVQAASGTLTINSNGTFSYVPQTGFTGTDQFVYEICDTQLKVCDKATAFILVKEPPTLYADLSVVKTGPAVVVPGETVEYQLTVTNLGTATATAVQLGDYLPSAILTPSYRVAGSSVQNNWPGYYDLATLEVNRPFSLFISGVVAANAPDTLKNVATVASAVWDPVAANNVSTVNTLVRRGPVARILGAPYLAVGSCDSQGRVLDASISSGEGLLFSWSPSVYLDNPASSKPVFLPGQTTRYKLTVTDNTGQKDTTSVLVIVPDAPKAITENNVYVDAPNATVLLDGSKSTGSGLSFLWLSKEGIILNGETTPTAQVSGLGVYYLQVTDSLGCFNKDSVNVGLYIQAINDTAQTNVNESVVINVLKNDIPKESLNPSSISIVTPPLHGIATISADSLILYMPEETYIGQDEFVYQVCDYFAKCDQAKVLVFINDVPFFIPEAFSPNGDGINDKFEIKGLAKYKTVEIEIFNRWGNVVYRSANYGEGPGKDGFWDGTAQMGVRIGSGPVPSGTYFYILKLNGKESINGSLYLGR